MMENIKRVWDFLQEDTLPSLGVTLIIAFVVIKFIFFPGLSFLTGTNLPLVIVESCSMHHYEDGLNQSFESPVYGDYGLSVDNSTNWDFQNGLDKGDVIFVVGAKNPRVGDVIIFDAGAAHPIIHRLIRAGNNYSTKGDNYKTNYRQLGVEKNISRNQLVGRALFRVPFIGWAKLIFFEGERSPRERGLCR